MYIINSVRALATPHKDGYSYYNAEAHIQICDENGNEEKEAYVLVHRDATMYRFFYCCTYESMYDLAIANPETAIEFDFIERFDFIEEAVDSEFLDLYRLLDKLISNNARGLPKPITYQAQLFEPKSCTHVIEETDEVEEEYYFSITQPLEYSNEIYEITFSINSDDDIEIILKKDGTILEQYDDLQEASQSAWLVIYCRVKEQLIDLINHYYKENRATTGLNIARVTQFLYKDWTDLKSQQWTQK